MTPNDLKKSENKYTNAILLIVVPFFLILLKIEYFSYFVDIVFTEFEISLNKKKAVFILGMAWIVLGFFLISFIQKRILLRCRSCNVSFSPYSINQIIKTEKCHKCGVSVFGSSCFDSDGGVASNTEVIARSKSRAISLDDEVNSVVVKTYKWGARIMIIIVLGGLSLLFFHLLLRIS